MNFFNEVIVYEKKVALWVFLTVNLLFSGYLSAAHVCIKVLNSYENSGYLLDDFSVRSEFSPFSGVKSKHAQVMFSNWAKKSSNEVIKLLKEQINMESIFNYIMVQRYALAIHLKAQNAVSFGRPRPDHMEGESTSRPPEVNVIGSWPNSSVFVRPGRAYLLKEAVDRFGIGLKRPKENIEINPNKVQLENGDWIQASQLKYDYERDSVFILSPRKRITEIIFNDVLVRAAKLSNKKLSKVADMQEAKIEFLKLMFNYYNSMPFERGSSSIGQVYFAGLFYHLFKTKMPIIHGLDFLAMVSKEPTFLNKVYGIIFPIIESLKEET